MRFMFDLMADRIDDVIQSKRLVKRKKRFRYPKQMA
jgi:hypothetical protein